MSNLDEVKAHASAHSVKKPSGLRGTERLNAFSDGVFAIVITLLILEVRVPDVAAQDLPRALMGLAPDLIAYVISFILLGVYWMGHHGMFTFIKRYDRTLLWLNLLFLLFISAMPFPTSLLVRYGDQPISMVIYCATLILAGVTAVAMWRHASRHYRLIAENLDPEVIALTYRRVLTAPIIYMVALATLLINLNIAKALLLFAILFYIIPNPVTQLHHHYGHQEQP